MLRKLSAAVVAALLALVPPAQACTGMMVTAKDGSVVGGRTLEFGVEFDWAVTTVPVGASIPAALSEGPGGLTIEAKHGFVGMSILSTNDFLDGINDAGLYVGMFYFPGYASYPKLNEANRDKAIPPEKMATWLLANFTSVDDVKAHIDDVVVVQSEFAALKQVLPLHVRVIDKSGKSLVIEPTDETLKVFDDPYGVITNSPTFDWHLTNLNNYVNLSVTNVPPITVGGHQLRAAGQGAGMHGLPGDFTPPSRFVRAAVFSQAAEPSETGIAAVKQVFHLLNNFDIPYGAVRAAGDKQDADYTQWTSVADLKNGVFYVKTYADNKLRFVDLAKALAATGDKPVTIATKSWVQEFDDITAEMK